MHIGVMTCPTDTPVPEAVQLLLQNGLEALVVLDENGHAAGLFGRREAIAAYGLSEIGREGIKLQTVAEVLRPDIPEMLAKRLSGLYTLLDRKYYFDDLWISGFAAGGRRAGAWLWHRGDEFLIDGLMVNGTANSVARLAGVLRHLQTGYLYHYAFAMIIALTLFLGWLLWLD